MMGLMCHNCLYRCIEWKWHNNAKVCLKCWHNLQPISVRNKAVEEIPPTLKNLKKILEKKY